MPIRSLAPQVGWLLVDLICAARTFTLSGSGVIGAPMLLVLLFQVAYILDALYYEQSILTTIDMTTDGLGFSELEGKGGGRLKFYPAATPTVDTPPSPPLPLTALQCSCSGT